MTPISGSIVALVTPMLEDGSIDYPHLRSLIEWHISQGTDCIGVVGTTGESPTVTVEEHCEIIRVSVEQAKGRVPIMAGCGANSTSEAIELAKFAKNVGADCQLQVVPYYNKPTQEGQYLHFRAIAETVNLPMVLYNVPGRTGSNMSSETTVRLARDFKNIIAIKEASANLDQMGRILKHRPKDFMLISGDDTLTLPIIALGGVGVISVVGNALPAETSALVKAALKGDLETARREHLRMIEVIDLLFAEGNPGGIKHVLKVLGICGDTMRLPLVNISEATAGKLYKALADAEVVKL